MCILCNAQESELDWMIGCRTDVDKQVRLCSNCNERFENEELSNDEMIKILECVK